MSVGALSLTLTSSAFKNDGVIPIIYTCKGKNISPPLSWSGMPKNTDHFDLILSDPDAPSGTWIHWNIYHLPMTMTGLEEDVQMFPEGTEILANSWDEKKYGGPCPPSGTHHYIFTLTAKDENNNTLATAKLTGLVSAVS